MKVPGPQNTPTAIGGREFSGHALDQMQGRGFMPSVVENTIQRGTTFPTRTGTTGYFDPVNRVRVITDTASGRVVNPRSTMMKTTLYRTVHSAILHD